MATVKSLGAALKSGMNGGLLPCRAKRLAMFAPGLCAMLRIAVPVSDGEVLPFFALAKSVVHGAELGPVELTQAARMLARVSMTAWGTIPLVPSDAVLATPVLRVSRFTIAASA